MKAVEVRYVVRPEFADRNRANIERVMAALRAAPIEGVKYAAFTLEDGVTFVHMNIARDERALAAFTSMDEFKTFQSELKASEPVSPPVPESLDFVAAGFDI